MNIRSHGITVSYDDNFQSIYLITGAATLLTVIIPINCRGLHEYPVFSQILVLKMNF